MKNFKFNRLPVLTFGIIVGLTIAHLSSYTMMNPDFPDSWIPIIIGSMLITALLTLAHVESEVDKVINGLHWKRFIIRTIILVATVIIILRFNYPDKLWPLFWINAFTFGIIFDPRLNYLQGNEWDYAGTESGYDILANKFSTKILAIGEMILLAITIC